MLFGFGEDGEGSHVEAVGHAVEDLVDFRDDGAAVAAGGAPKEEERVAAGHVVEGPDAAGGVEEDELGGFTSDEEVFPLGGTSHLLVDGRGREEGHLAGGEVALDEVDVDFVVDHDIALEVAFGEGEDEPLEDLGGGLGAVDEGVEQGDDEFGGEALHALVDILVDAIVEY